MKRVFAKTAEVCAAWAAGTHNDFEGARTGSNTWSRHGALYSYGTCIAQAMEPYPGLRVALVTTKGYSSGTSKVQGEAITAARLAGLPVFKTYSVKPADGEGFPEFHRGNLARYEKQIADAISRIERCRTWSAHSIRAEAVGLIGEAHLYAETFAFEWAYRGPNPLGVTALSERREAA